MPIIRLPEPEAGPSGTNSTPVDDTTPTPTSSHHPLSSIESSDPTRSDTQGDQTPHSSNPPQIFAPSGASSPSEEDEVPEPVEPQDLRKMASEAALRRMTLRSRSSASPIIPLIEKTSSPLSRPHTPEPDVEEEEVIPIPPSPKLEMKGKGKAKEEVDPMDEVPTVNAYLTQSGSDLLPSPTERSSGRRREIFGGCQPTTFVETQDALESRLKVLREVDEVVWALVGELSRVKSGWEREADGDRDGPPS